MHRAQKPNTGSEPRRSPGRPVLPGAVALIAMLLAAPLWASTDRSGDEAAASDDAESAVAGDAGSESKAWYRNIVPLPIIITEPAIGDGLGVAFGYFHPEKSANYRPRSIEQPGSVRDLSLARKPPPTVTGVFGAYTSNGTWAAGVGHMDTFREDTIRYTGAAAYANVIADFYVFDQPFEFNLEGAILYNDVKFRLGDSDWFLGVALSYLDARNTFRVEIPVGDDFFRFDFLASDFTDIGIKASVTYETRDDSMMPRSGVLLSASLARNDQALGGSYDYTTAKFKTLYFHPFGRNLVLGLRLESTAVFGDAPFFAVPWVNLRGVPAMRYQGDTATSAEIEARHYVNQDWLMSLFAGKGWASSEIFGIETGDSIHAWGFGGRYRFLKDQNVWVGLDYAIGPEDNVYYIKVGQGW